MKIMIGADHPKQVHFWRNIVLNLIEDGHEVKILTIDKDMTLQLLSAYGLDYEIYGKHQKSMVKKAYSMISRTYKAFIIAKRFMPDILIAGTPCLAYVGKMLGKPHIMLTDTEHASISYWLTYPFTDVIITPSCFKRKINSKKHVVYNGYEELAYLHPNYFKPDPSVLDDVGLSRGDKFIVLRFVALDASHDVHSTSGITDKLKLVKALEEYGQVFITSEVLFEADLIDYKLAISPEKIHSLLSYAQLYFGGGEAMAVESAIVGTPSINVEAIRISPSELVDISFIHGTAYELINKYKLMFAYINQDQALEKAKEILENKNSKKNWQNKSDKLLNEKIDVTKFITEFIECYPIKSKTGGFYK